MTHPIIPESSLTIAEWGDETFGKASSVLAYATRAQEELDELIQAITNNEGDSSIIAEAADVVILLHRLVGSFDAELSEAVDHKMSINRSRLWKKSGNGVGRHL